MKLAISAILLMILAPAHSQDRASTACLAGMDEELRAAHFSGPIVCSKDDASFILVGNIGPEAYSVFDYRYRFMPPNGAVMHGGQRLVVFKAGKYVGQYSLSPPPYADFSAEGSMISAKVEDGSEKWDIDFSGGPPQTIFVGGFNSNLFQ